MNEPLRPGDELLRAPAKIGPKGVHLWRKVQAECVAQGTFRPSDGPLLERYVRALLYAAELHAEAARLPLMVERDDGGKPKLNPAREYLQGKARQADHDAEQYAEALLLTPYLRKRYDLDDPTEDDGDAF